MDIKELIDDYTINNCGLNFICQKYKIGKLKAKALLSANGIEIKKKGKQTLNEEFIIKDFREKKYQEKDGFPLTMTETEMAKELGYDRIWDCGLFKFVWKKEKSEDLIFFALFFLFINTHICIC